MPTLPAIRTPLHEYIEADEGYYAAYEAYQPDLAAITRVNLAQPSAHVIVASRLTCPDCARHVPRMARLAEALPGWTWEIFASDASPERKAALGIERVPTFIVYDREDGNELGRIVENPASGSLELDLLRIVQGARP